MNNFIFTTNNKDQWSMMKAEFQSLQKSLLASKGGFEMTIAEINKSKTSKQLRGFHRLIDILVPYFKEWTGGINNRDSVKDYIKTISGFTTRYKGIQVPKSCKDATKEEMLQLIQEVERFASEMGIENCFLRSDERSDLENYYKKD